MKKYCFECDAVATETHHIIPVSRGGKRTVSLCGPCHAKVHGFDGTLRSDGTAELTNRAFDKKRLWELFAVHQCIEVYKDKKIHEIRNHMIDLFDYDLSESRVMSLKKRLDNMDRLYMHTLFTPLLTTK